MQFGGEVEDGEGKGFVEVLFGRKRRESAMRVRRRSLSCKISGGKGSQEVSKVGRGWEEVARYGRLTARDGEERERASSAM